MNEANLSRNIFALSFLVVYKLSTAGVEYVLKHKPFSMR